MLSARDIRNLKNSLKKKTFGGGYEVADVDSNFAQLATSWEALQEEKRMAEERADNLEAKLKHYEKVELALQEALETARDTARRTEESADRKARLIVEEAELRAQRIIQEAEQERYGLRQDLSTLTNRQNEVAARLRSFLMSELEILAQFQGEDPVGFIKLVAPERSVEARTLGTGGEASQLPPPAPLDAGGDLAAPAEIPVPEATAPVATAPVADASESAVPEPDAASTDASGDDAPTAAALEPDAPEAETANADAPEGPTPGTAAQDAEASGEASAAPEPEVQPEVGIDASNETPSADQGAQPSPEASGDDDALGPDDSDAAAYSDAFGDDTYDFPSDTDEPATPSRRSIPRSPWPDVETPTVPPSAWGANAADADLYDAGGSAPEGSTPEGKGKTPPAAPDWSSPASAFSADAPSSQGADAGSGWSLRSLVTGDGDADDADTPSTSEAERDKIRRILDDLD